MPTMLWRCCVDWEEWRSITDDARPPCPECGGPPDIVMVPPLISADALPNKRSEARAGNARDRKWERDMPAYKALRKDGMQPRSVDGSADLQARAETRMEVEMGRHIPRDKRSLAEEAQAEVRENARKGVAKEIGETLREMRKPKVVSA